MTNDLIAFLGARLDEDQAWAEACQGHRWQWVRSEDDQVVTANPAQEECLDEDSYGISLRSVENPDQEPSPIGHAEGVESSVAGHIVRHDPARVLRDVSADRKLLARYAEAVKEQEEALAAFRVARDEWGSSSEEYADAYKDWSDALLREGAFLTVIKDRVARFSDHPGYLQEWAP
ncbi:DUF6221 family protein [Streptosporangium sp. NPDC000239]|uniref:DUF6221 family protein n=1 Tax=Streptosporangium sp. NPDC000239 TaxID=3154248 RepID=UPI003326D34E